MISIVKFLRRLIDVIFNKPVEILWLVYENINFLIIPKIATILFQIKPFLVSVLRSLRVLLVYLESN